MKHGGLLLYVLIIPAFALSISAAASQTDVSFNSLWFENISQKRLYSQADQDKFVYLILYGLLGKQDKGCYLEIGAGEPIHINNTYFLETSMGWNGLSIDISDDLSKRWYAARKNPLLSQDALSVNYSDILRTFPKVIDYLSLDIDGYYDVVLQLLIETNHIFKIITIEHDFYRYGDLYRTKEREILTRSGYYLVCADVSNAGHPFEDWWIHPDFFPSDIFSELVSLNLRELDSAEVIQKVGSLYRRHEFEQGSAPVPK